MELFFDTETSGMIIWKESNNHKDQPWLVQLGAILSTESMIHGSLNLLIQPEGRKITAGAQNAHGISEEMCKFGGVPEYEALRIFGHMWQRATLIICHNVDFDLRILQIALERLDLLNNSDLFNLDKDFYCTMKTSTGLCKLPGYGGSYKWPRLQELHQYLFNEKFIGAHDAMEDVKATRRCYYEIMRREKEDAEDSSNKRDK